MSDHSRLLSQLANHESEQPQPRPVSQPRQRLAYSTHSATAADAAKRSAVIFAEMTPAERRAVSARLEELKEIDRLMRRRPVPPPH